MPKPMKVQQIAVWQAVQRKMAIKTAIRQVQEIAACRAVPLVEQEMLQEELVRAVRSQKALEVPYREAV